MTQLYADSEFFVRLLLAVLLGGLIGLERQSHGRPAGFRTNILVCLGSAAIIVAFQKLMVSSDVDAASAIRMDPARAASGIITGIGFLGAGTIIKNRNLVRGLTSAASIWIVSAVGISLGLGQYDIAIGVTLLVLLVLFLLDKIPIRSDHYGVLTINGTGVTEDAVAIIKLAETHKLVVKEDQLSLKPRENLFSLKLHLRYRKRGVPRELTSAIVAMEGVESLVWE